MNIQELMQELQAGEEARRQIPELNDQLSRSVEHINKLSDHNQQLELRAKDREDQISKLLERVRIIERERDDALMAEMEAQENLKSFRGVVEKFSSAVGSALSGVAAANEKLDPPKPVPMTEGNAGSSLTSEQAQDIASSQSTGSQGQSETHPIDANTAASGSTEPKESFVGNAEGQPGTSRSIPINEVSEHPEWLGRANDPNWKL